MDKEGAKERAERYIVMTENALSSIEPKKTAGVAAGHARDVIDTASRYLSDAKYFHGKGDLIAALATVNYAHGWIDAGKKVGLFRQINKK